MIDITFGDFAKLMSKRRRNIDDLVDLFRGKLDENRPLFERIMNCKQNGLEEVVIPFKLIRDYYDQEAHFEEEVGKGPRLRKRGGLDS